MPYRPQGQQLWRSMLDTSWWKWHQSQSALGLDSISIMVVVLHVSSVHDKLILWQFEWFSLCIKIVYFSRDRRKPFSLVDPQLFQNNFSIIWLSRPFQYSCRYIPKCWSLGANTMSTTIFVSVHIDSNMRKFGLVPFYIPKVEGWGGG